MSNNRKMATRWPESKRNLVNQLQSDNESLEREIAMLRTVLEDRDDTIKLLRSTLCSCNNVGGGSCA